MKTIDFKHLSLSPDHRILDLGCGEGRHAIALACESHVDHIIGLDINPKDIDTANRKLEETQSLVPLKSPCDFICSDGMRLPFEDGYFDVIICSEVLEHIPDYQSMLAEATRVLTPKGVLAVSVPRAWPERLCWRLSDDYHNTIGGHIRIFTEHQLKSTIQSFAYKPYFKHWAHALHSPYWWLRCALWHKGERHFLIKKYHQLLVWDLMSKPWITRALERCLNPIMGKSIVMYFRKNAT